MRTAGGGAADDPVDAHIAALAAALRGPARVKDRLLAELREGLTDAARDLSSEAANGFADGSGPDHARASARRAVREFGTVAELAPSYQRELTIAQARRTARAVALIVPFLLLCWTLVGAADHATGHGPPDLVRLLAAHLGGVVALTALLAAGALAATGVLARRLPTPERLPLLVAWTGTTAAAALALSALTLTAAAFLAADWPLSVAAGVVTIAFHARLAASARACRECARLTVTGS